MKRSDALVAGIRPNLQTDLRRAGYQGALDDIPAVITFLRARPMLDVEIPETEPLPVGTKTLRPEQAQFRREVFRAYGGKCALTGESCHAVLEAAHLPGRSHELGHNRASDGILLRIDLHKLMDEKPPLMILQRQPDGIVVRIKPAAGAYYAQFNGKKIRQPKRIHDCPAL